MAEIAELVFTPLEAFAAVDEPGAEPLARTPGGGTVIPANGTVMFYGDGGAGKTTLELDLVFALASGRPWLELVAADRPLRVSVIEAEGPRQEFRTKLRAKLAHHGDLDSRVVVLEEPWADYSFASHALRRATALHIVENETDLLVVGPTTSVGSFPNGGTPHEISCFEEQTRQLRELVERPVAILLAHHENRAGQISGAWERLPDTLAHVTGQGHGRTRIYWQKCRHSSALHGTTTQLVWADGETYTVEAKPEITEDTIADEILAAVRDNPGASWRKIREHVTGTGTETAKVRDHLIAAGAVVDAAARNGYFNLWQADDPANPGSQLRTASEPLTGLPPAGALEVERFAVPLRSREPLSEPHHPDVPEATVNGYHDHELDDLYADLVDRGLT